MPEPITAVWGVYDRARELVMLKPYDCTGNGWPEGYTVQRLPLATPEMVADAERLDWMERDHNALVYPALRVQSGADGFGVTVKHEEGRGFSPNGKLREAIDAARAAGGAHGP